MQQLAQWLRRLKDATPENLSEAIFRVMLLGDGPIGFTDTIVKLEPVGRVAERPGSTEPTALSFLRFYDIRGTQPTMTSAVVASEIGSLLALASDRRIEVAMELMLTVQGRPQTEKTLLPLGSVLDRRARGPLPADLREEFIQLAGRLSSLSADDVAAVGDAANLHYAALLLAELDIRSAYVLLVAALEVLSRAYGNPPSDWTDWEDSARWDAVMTAAGLSLQQSEAIRAQLLSDKHLRLKATFREYVATQLPEEFLSGTWTEWMRPVSIADGVSKWGALQARERPMRTIVPDRATLRSALGRTYDLRSGIVHKGDDVRLMDVGLREGAPIGPKEPLPYPLLRQVVRSLIMHELSKRSSPQPLPDIRCV